MSPGTRVEVEGLKDLVRAFNAMDRDLGRELSDELGEAAEPVRKTAEQYIVSGGGGFPGMRNIAARGSYWEQLKVGVSRSVGTAYIVPAWKSNKGTPQGAHLSFEFKSRMEGAVENKQSEVVERLGTFLDDLGKEWAR